MSQISSLTNTVAQPPGTNGPANALNELNLDHFLQLMIAQLQNQDPLNPLENHELLQQISQIREVGATDKLSSTLEAVLLGQNIGSATRLMGQQIRATTETGQPVEGVVDRVTIVNGTPLLHLGEPTRSTVGVSTESGSLEPGTYHYRVVIDNGQGQLSHSLTLGPITTTGTAGVDQSVELANLPVTAGVKRIYRTDASGTGDFRLVAELEGSATSYVDSASTAAIPGSALQEITLPFAEATTITVPLHNVIEIQRLANGLIGD